MNLGDQKLSAQVSFTRPEQSGCLAGLKDKNPAQYEEALAIIEAGKTMLAGRPRADMAGFRLVDPIEINQEAKYQERLQSEHGMRAAIATGEKKFEQDPDGSPE